MQRCKSYCTFGFAVISNVTFFTSLGIRRNSGKSIAILNRLSSVSPGINVSTSINNNFFYVEHESHLQTRFQNGLIKV